HLYPGEGKAPRLSRLGISTPRQAVVVQAWAPKGGDRPMEGSPPLLVIASGPTAGISASRRSATAGSGLRRCSTARPCCWRLADEGLKAWQQVIERGYEGLVAKDPASLYRGGRTLAWLKVQVPRYREGERGSEAKPSDRGASELPWTR